MAIPRIDDKRRIPVHGRLARMLPVSLIPRQGEPSPSRLSGERHGVSPKGIAVSAIIIARIIVAFLLAVTYGIDRLGIR